MIKQAKLGMMIAAGMGLAFLSGHGMASHVDAKPVAKPAHHVKHHAKHHAKHKRLHGHRFVNLHMPKPNMAPVEAKPDVVELESRITTLEEKFAEAQNKR